MTSRWQPGTVILLAAGLALTIALGTRHTFGLFLQPMSLDLGWGRQTFSYAIAMQNLVFGLAQPFTGVLADKYGSGRVMLGGAVLYVIGLVLMAHTGTGWQLGFSAGLVIGIAVSCVSFSIVYGAVARAYPPEKRTLALGIAGAAGSLGQFVMLPYGQALITHMGWHQALLILAVTVMLIVPLCRFVTDTPREETGPRQSAREAIREAFTHRGFLLLCSAYWVCGFQLMFISVHFPAYMIDRGMSPAAGVTALALIGLFNIFGSYAWGWLGQRYTKKYLLSLLYLLRAAGIAAFIAAPLSNVTVYLFGAVIGFLWLGTAPLTSGLIAQIFGVRYMSTLTGAAFMFHQLGSFLGIALAGFLFDRTGSYNLMWGITIAAGVFAAIANWPIDDRRVVRPGAAQPA